VKKSHAHEKLIIQLIVVAILCGIGGVYGGIYGFTLWVLPVILVPIGFYAFSIRVLGNGSCIEMGVQAIILAIVVAVLLSAFQKRATMHQRSVTPKTSRFESGGKPQSAFADEQPLPPSCVSSLSRPDVGRVREAREGARSRRA